MATIKKGILSVIDHSWAISSNDQENWLPSQTTEGLINQQANVYEDYLTLSFTPTLTAKYQIDCSGINSHNVTNDNMRININIDSDDNSLQEDVEIYDKESKDSAASGENFNIVSGGVIVGSTGSGTDNKKTHTWTNFYKLSAGVVYTIKKQFCSQSVNDEATLHEGNIIVKLFSL